MSRRVIFNPIACTYASDNKKRKQRKQSATLAPSIQRQLAGFDKSRQEVNIKINGNHSVPQHGATTKQENTLTHTQSEHTKDKTERRRLRDSITESMPPPPPSEAGSRANPLRPLLFRLLDVIDDQGRLRPATPRAAQPTHPPWAQNTIKIDKNAKQGDNLIFPSWFPNK